MICPGECTELVIMVLRLAEGCALMGKKRMAKFSGGFTNRRCELREPAWSRYLIRSKKCHDLLILTFVNTSKKLFNVHKHVYIYTHIYYLLSLNNSLCIV